MTPDDVKDRASFVQFVKYLKSELVENEDSWENNTLPKFLEALSSYAEDIQGYYDNTNQSISADVPTWKFLLIC